MAAKAGASRTRSTTKSAASAARRAKRTDSDATGRVSVRLRKELGARLREAREARNMSLRELARRLNLSPSLISQVETGKSQPSISTLFAMVGELEVPVNEVIWDADAPDSDSRSSSQSQAIASQSPLQRANQRLSIHIDSGVSWQRLTSQPDHDVDFLLLRYEPGGQSTAPESLMRHNGKEYGYILGGRLRVTIGFESYELGPGDSISFDCTEPHRLAAVGDRAVEAVWFVLGRRHTATANDEAGPEIS
jgi:transcriptional regulator with XRE-family HTH domain